MGQTGNVTGLHLHFEVKTHGALLDNTGNNFAYTNTYPNNYGYLDPWGYMETSAFTPTPIKVTHASGLYVRRGPDASNYSAFMSLSPGQQFVAFARHVIEGDVWYRIHLSCGNGYSCAGWVAGTVGGTTFSELTAATNQVEVIGTDTEGLNVRSSPSGFVINKVYDGQRFVFTETDSPGNDCGSNWYRVDLPWVANTDEFYGWVCGDFLTISNVTSVSFAKLNDTGITTCSDNSQNGLPCPVNGFPGQDAEHGRDALAAAGLLQKVGGGSAGFDFTKLDNNGNPLPVSATEWSCVKDNHTGLIWEEKTTSGLRSMNHTYTWYNPDSSTNGGDPGVQNSGNCSGSSCDTHGYVQAVNAQGLCGANDWRMPTRDELRGIIDYSQTNPAIDTDYFPHTPSSQYWSALPHAYFVGFAWSAYFHYGSGGIDGKTSNNHVRLVRDRQ